MKTSNTSNIEAQRKPIEFHSINLPRLLAKALLISVCLLLFYSSLYLWSIAFLLVSLGAIRIYRWYKEMNAIDWSVDISDITMEDIIDDLENR